MQVSDDYKFWILNIFKFNKAKIYILKYIVIQPSKNPNE